MYRNTFLQKKIILLLIILLTLSSIIVIFLNPTNQTSQRRNTLNENGNIKEQNQLNSYSNTKNVLQQLSNSYFTKNTRQIPGLENVKYYYQALGYQVNFLQSEIQFISRSQSNSDIISFSLNFPGSNKVSPSGFDKLTRTNNYFIGLQKTVNVPLYKAVIYYNIYNGIDLKYYFSSEGLKYDFIVHAGSNPNQILVQTSQNTYLNSVFSTLNVLNKETNNQLFQDSNLFVYQRINSQAKSISASFKINSLQENIFSYTIDSYDTNIDLIIDPVLVVNTSTYLGGSSADEGIDIIRDAQNNIYITGITYSTDFITLNPMNASSNGDQDIFILKLDPSATSIQWATYFGGNGEDQVNKIGLDKDNNIVIAGYSDSTNLPLLHSQNSDLNGTQDIIVASFSNDGQQLKLCSLIGGEDIEDALGLYIPPNAMNYYVTGYTDSANFTTTPGAYNTTFGGFEDAFFINMSSSGMIEYSSFIGGNRSDAGQDIFVDNNNNIYLLGSVAGNLSGQINHGISNDVFVMKFSSGGKSLDYTKLIGGTFSDIPASFVVKNDEIYLAGRSFSADFPNTTILGETQTDDYAFVVKLNSSTEIEYSTLIAVNGSVFVNKLAVDSTNRVIIAGSTNSDNLPLQDDIKHKNDGTDCFIMIFNSQGSGLTYSTYIGGSDIDSINSFVLGSDTDIYTVGSTNSRNYPVSNAMQDHIALPGSSDATFTKLSLDKTKPTLGMLPDFSIQFNTTGHYMSFNASDNDPYATFDLYGNDSLITSGLITENDVNFSIDNLAVGTYNYTVVAKDRSGNTISKSTIVTVLSPDNNKPGPDDLLLIIVFVLSAILFSGSVVGYFRYYKNKNQNKGDSGDHTQTIQQSSASEISSSIDENQTSSDTSDNTSDKPPLDTDETD